MDKIFGGLLALALMISFIVLEMNSDD